MLGAKRQPAALTLAILLLAPPATRAQDLFVLGAGGTDVLSGNKPAAEVRLEYRSGLSAFPFTEPYLAVHPWTGIEVTTRGSVWGGAGLLLDIPLNRFALVPQFGAGAYSKGDGKDLGSTLEFRTGIEAQYKLDPANRIALDFSHTSNAGITRHNPGTEALTVNFQHAFWP